VPTAEEAASLICRYDVLVENLMDPAHFPYAHKGWMGEPSKTGLGPNMGLTANKEDPGRYAP
jgi:phenylpropionate dioxygenase-like ring-hydroxylating dioxygenase large terminal subunit